MKDSALHGICETLRIVGWLWGGFGCTIAAKGVGNMDQIRIGRFIAQCRKTGGLTQRQLADGLGISDKTVSKWECGNGLPEVSLMLPLCAALGITVNDLLSGERVAQADYQKKAEENMMELIRENAENKKRLALSLICAAITGIAVCALIALAAFLTLPAAARIALIALALITGAAGVGAAAVLDARAGYYQCPHCKATFTPALGEYVKAYHTFTRRRLVACPPRAAGRGLCRRRITR